MIKDTLIRLLFIPILGISISYASGVISYNKYTALEIAGSCSYFILTSFFIWRGSQWIHLKLRKLYTMKQNPIPKIISVCVLSGLYGSSIAGIFCIGWFKFSKEEFRWVPLSKVMVLSVLAVIVFTLVYEILYLGKEKELANKIVDQLDVELTRAEVTASRNELDPHFIFNSLGTLSNLISNDSAKADLFNNKLAEVYKYFLMNKDKETVPVKEEIEFIKNYFFLLKIKHEDKLDLRMEINEDHIKDLFIIPYALQILIENVIKHNDFTKDQPIKIWIKTNSKYLSIENTVRKKAVSFINTKIGLEDLVAQYLLIANKNILVEENGNQIVIKLPLIKLPKTQYA